MAEFHTGPFAPDSRGPEHKLPLESKIETSQRHGRNFKPISKSLPIPDRIWQELKDALPPKALTDRVISTSSSGSVVINQVDDPDASRSAATSSSSSGGSKTQNSSEPDTVDLDTFMDQIEEENDIDMPIEIKDPTKAYLNLDQALKALKLKPEEITSVKKLATLIPEDKLLLAINSYGGKPDVQGMLVKTFLRASYFIKNGEFPANPCYRGKLKDSKGEIISFSFLVKQPNLLYIGLLEYAKGGNNKINQGLDITNSKKTMKRQSWNSKRVPGATVSRSEEKLQTELAQSNPRILKPLGVNITTVAVGKRLGHEKYVSFIPRMDGDLDQALELLTAKEVVQVLRDVAQGVAHMHEVQNIVHGDLKPQNILIRFNKDDKVVAKITDFGAAGEPGHPGSGSVMSAPPEYFTSPAQFKPTSLEFAVDSYGLGVTILESLYLTCVEEQVFDVQGSNFKINNKLLDPNLKQKFFEDLIRGMPKGMDDIYAPLIHLAQKLMANDPIDRPTMAQAAAELDFIYKNI